MKKNNNKKLIIFLSIVISIFCIGIVIKPFQNDTFFNISIGKHLLENGIDMQEHFTWAQKDLYYSHSHWLFDIIIYLIYSIFNFTGIYITTILFTILTALILFWCLSKRGKSPVISFFVTIFCIYITQNAFAARSQMISFLFFIIEIYCIEQFIETNKRIYPTIVLISGIIVANVHAATWPLMLILMLPYFAAAISNIFTSRFIYKKCIKNLEKKISKLPPESERVEMYKKDIKDYERLIEERKGKYSDYKVIKRDFYNVKGLIILFILLALTGLITPIHGTPYTYIIKSMFGTSNFGALRSYDHIAEMQATMPFANLPFLAFMITIIAFLAFVPSKLKSEHGFLLAGLIFMGLSSNRYAFLLVLVGAYVLNDLIISATNILIKDDIEILEKIFSTKISFIILVFLTSIFTTNHLLDMAKYDYANEEMYPIKAVEYIKENLDYKNIRIYNGYNYGSYLMFNDIPVFIDSRLDVYCSEFNDTDIFYDYIYITDGIGHYEDVFDKYDFTHILLYTDEVTTPYLKTDIGYEVIYEDENFTLFEKH